VVVLGVGGSAIGADVVATLATHMSNVPVQVVRGYSAPPPDEDTLIVACSYSGETEETLQAFQPTLGGTGMRLAIAGGGRLARLAGSLGYELFQYDFQGQPRAALGWGVFPLLAILQRLGALGIEDGTVEAALTELERAAGDWGIETPHGKNAAKQIAAGLTGRAPLIVGPDILEVAARRWAGQLSENAKQWAFHAALPEVDHNLIVGFGAPRAANSALHVLFLDGLAVHERNRLRVRLTGEALDAASVTHDELLIGGVEPLDAVLRACYLGDWVSLYLAMLNGVDPTPVAPIDRLKQALSPH
jgi:glucose/mannose-6-phosphate isomerase